MSVSTMLDSLKQVRIAGSQAASLPSTRDLSLAYAVSFAIAVLVAVAALVGLTGLFVVIDVGNIVTAPSSQPAGVPGLVPVWIADSVTVIPTCLVGGFLLWRRGALGYVAAAGLLHLFGSLA